MNVWNMASVIKDVEICREVTTATVMKDMNLHLDKIHKIIQKAILQFQKRYSEKVVELNIIKI
jgi:hypothetical protein